MSRCIRTVQSRLRIWVLQTGFVDAPILSLTSHDIRVLYVMPCPFPRVHRESFVWGNSRNWRHSRLIRALCRKNCFFNMSWNIQRPEGVRGIEPPEAQPCISHEQLLSNRDGETDRDDFGNYFVFDDLFLCPPAVKIEISDFRMVYPCSFIFKRLLGVLSLPISRCSFGAKALAKRTQKGPREQRNNARFVLGYLSSILPRSPL